MSPPHIIPILALHAACAAAYAAGLRFRAAAYAAMLLHAATLVWHLFPAAQLGLGAVLSLFMLATYATVYRTLRFMSTRRLLSLLTAAAMLMPLLLPPTTATPSFTLHAVLALAAYVAAACAFLHWLDLRTAERLLRRRPQITFSPPLLNDERWCFRHVGAAFVLLTLTLVSGFLAQPDDFSLTHKNLFALLTWLTFLALLLGRRLFGWRGKAAQLWFFVGYVFLLLSYIGSTFVLQFILGRG